MASETNFTVLINKLDEFIRKYYKNQLIKGGIYFFIGCLLLFISVNLLEYLGQFNTSVRTALFYTFLFGNLYLLSKYIFIPLLKLNRLGKIINHKTAANIIGKHFITVQDKLLNILQLKELSDNQGISSSLISASVDQKIEDLKPVPFSSAINFKENKKYLKYAIAPILLLLVIVFAAPKMITESTERLIEHRTYFEPVAPFQFNVLNNELEAVQFEDFQLEVKITGKEIPQNVYLNIGDNTFKLDKKSKLEFGHTFKNLQNALSFSLFADGFSSQPYDLAVLPNPIILNFDIKLDYPNYLERKDEELHNSGELLIPEGTKVTWNFIAQSTEKIKLSFNDTVVYANQNGSNSFSFTKQLRESGGYVIVPSNKELTSRDSISYNMNVIPDLYPTIDVEEQIDSSTNKLYYFMGEIKDDHGLTKLTFNYRYINSSDTSVTVLENNAFELSLHENATVDQFFHYWDLHELPISSGDVIEYYFKIWDNDAVNGRKSTRSKTRIFKAPSKSELKEITEQANENIKKQLGARMDEAKELKEDIKKFREKILAKRQLDWQDKKALEELLKKQKELLNDVEKLQNENSLKTDQQQEYQEQEKRITEKQEKLEELFDEIVNEEMKKLFEELERLMDEMNKNDLLEDLEEFELSNQDLENELDRMLELFKQLEFEQKLEEAIKDLEELAQKEEELSEKTEDKTSDNQDLTKEQEELNKQFEEIKTDLSDLEKKNQELEFPHGMDPTEEQQQSIQQDLQQSMDELQKGKNKKASQSQKKASKKMQQLANKLEAMQSNMQMQAMDEDLDALRQLLENLIKLSFEQEALIDKLSITKTSDPKYVELTQQQFNIKEDAEMIEDSLLALSKRMVEISTYINREIGEVNHNMEKAISAMADRNLPQAKSRQQFVMTAVNNIAVLLSEVLEQLQQQMAKQMPGKQQCEKPGGANSIPKMSKLQQQLNDQIKEMKNSMGKPGKQGQKSQMSKELAEMAAQQSAIRKQLEKLNELQNKDGQKKLGDLEKISELMDQTETDLVNKRITQETLKRQEKIMLRLLESEKAMRQQDTDNKRESKEGNIGEKRNLITFQEYKRLKENEIELLKTVPPSLNPYYKDKVNRYFQKLDQ